jgi:2-acylglycerol O-acyltransferase 2
VVKTCDLDPRGNYLFGYHPHGIICVGAAYAFGTDAAGFASLFPGLRVSLAVLKPLFYVPFYRDWLQAHDIVSAARHTCLALLGGPPGRSICLAIGGAKEAISANPNTMELVIRSRKGFVRVAVQTGASLVPVVSEWAAVVGAWVHGWVAGWLGGWVAGWVGGWVGE